MGQKTYLGISGAIFGIVAVLHLIRAIYGWPAQIGTWEVPMWVSWASFFVAGLLAVSAFILLKR